MTALDECRRLIWLHLNARPTNNFHAMSDGEIEDWLRKQGPYVEFLRLYERQCREDLKQATGEHEFEAGELDVAAGVLECRRLNMSDERSQ